MKFNIDKCMVLSVTLKRNPLLTDYCLHNQKLLVVSKAKYLGVILDSKLSFNDHVDATCKKANSVLSFLRINLKHCNKIDAYNSFVRPILNYAAPVWAPHANYHINKIESIQKRAAQFVMSDFRGTSSTLTMLTSLI